VSRVGPEPYRAVVDDTRRRAWLKRRLDIEARAYAGADPKVKLIRWGRLLAFLEIGVRFGWWSHKAASAYSDAAYYGGRRPNSRRLDR
jgi:hypothetical protein